MKLVLFDINKELCDAWKKYFNNCDDVEIKNCSFEELTDINYMVTAGNSYGWMTGGIDLAVRNYFGIELQDRIQECIIYHYNGMLPIGDFIIADTNRKNIKNIIYAPTMRIPSRIYPIDVYYVFYNILECFIYEKAGSDDTLTLACCGLGTLTGRISPEECAKAMKDVYNLFKERKSMNEK